VFSPLASLRQAAAQLITLPSIRPCGSARVLKPLLWGGLAVIRRPEITLNQL